MKSYRIAILFAASVICLSEHALCGTTNDQGSNLKFSSARNLHPFVGATKVVLTGFDPAESGSQTAMLQLDKNEVTYSTFGDPSITAVFYKPVQVKLTPLSIADPSANRRLFAVELPKEHAADLGKNSLRLLTPTGAKSDSAAVRLLLVNPDNKVTQVLELQAASN